jgi:osmotically inducible lipoprotein OsmB
MKNNIRIILLTFACTGLGACAHWSSAEQGTAIGGVTGAAVGNVITGGSALGTVGGAAVGGVIGHEIGRNQDQQRRYKSRY